MKYTNEVWKKLKLTPEVEKIFSAAKSVYIPESREAMIEVALGGEGSDSYAVEFDLPSGEKKLEATVHRCRNGISVNYSESYMRRRDPNSMLIADDRPTDKKRYSEKFDKPFGELRTDIFDWLAGQDLIAMAFYAGANTLKFTSLVIAPRNSAFFPLALADIQGFIPAQEIEEGFEPRAIAFVAPTFRHIHCDGKQHVIHKRYDDFHEIYSLNLYPGPSAKKGIYSVLLDLAENEEWVTLHGATVQVTTPYDNQFVIMHEGASGGGKSEMLQYPHRQPDGRLLIGENLVDGKRRYIPSFQGCVLSPVTDDMALAHNDIQNDSKKLVVQDAEEGWFVRVNHITHYGVDRYLEELCTNPADKLFFLNMYSVPNATCLIWEHIEDEPGVLCPNPRVIIPRHIVPDIVNEPIEVDVRSFGVRTPPCTKDAPTYGIIGLLHILPPAVAWLWRLVSPRGFGNPSISGTSSGMQSEGVGSYWPFATGRKVTQANLLLRQIINTPKTRYTLSPNQHIGAWKVDFMPQWIAREYMSRRGSANFKDHQLDSSRCPLLGYAFHSMQIEGFFINKHFLQVETQDEVGVEAYDAGAKILTDFFKEELAQYLKEDDLDPMGRQIVELCMRDATIDEYEKIIHR